MTNQIDYDKVDIMKRKMMIFFSFFYLFLSASPVLAFWVWTPESNKWINPKFAVKETPQKQFEYAMEFFEAEQYPEALREFNKMLKHYSRAKEAADAQHMIGTVLETQGKLYEAFRAYQLVIEKYPFSEKFPKIVAKQFELGNRMLDGEGDPGLMKSLVGSEYDVIEIFETIIKNAPYGEYAAPSQYKIALYLQGKKLYQEARDEFEKVINDYPDSEWAKASKYQLAITDAQRSPGAEYDQKVTQIAVEGFKDFVKSNPRAELSEDALGQIKELREKEAENNFLVAKFYEKQKNYEAAKIYYHGIVSDFKDTPWAVKSLERIREIEARE